ncbi:polysaccharide deacetylase family protein [Halalkalicoccus jeotgali]|uniref:Polysaccharide deacetylase n=1 Tax=Halalkalicoccus jeotgali (strain DSM 18796 / CECT 7217 / JCM 14584 / KCTC 4019 / B3) TaxID=795797 RepID=D8J473_HALJB|nr:polysaccharide deacetylase family protein [Halalkalicoccus jeotgali]ADJ15465.1 polysaccharide deacetylase [Halalkalicoccus jeotgali B3]ELY36126.1 polysaccharide deacetylase [Halalkalicoccus jeotgali B3]
MGTVVLSIDAELAWGFHDLADPPRDRIAAARPAWSCLLAALDEFSIPATWAVVGHLLLEECDGIHADHPRSPEWFARDPGGSADEHEAWFGPDLVRAVHDSAVDHEIASHGFSHVEFGDPATTRRTAIAEIEASIEAADRMGLALRSFVFPRNNVGHRDVLAAYGFRSYRGLGPDRWFDAWPARRAGKLLDAALVRSDPPLVTPTVDEYGLVNLPASLDLFGFEGAARTLLEPAVGDPVLRQAKAGIDRAVDGEGVCHLWLHPNNLLAERDVERLRAVLSHLAARREDSSLTVETMGAISERVAPEPGPTPR